MNLAETAEQQEAADPRRASATHASAQPELASGLARKFGPPLPESDPRCQLSERILASEAFQKSVRLSDLLRYLAAQSLGSQRGKLTEQAIGRAVLGKSQSYTPAEDSSVRVYVRQLRLRLLEYYDGAGKNEALLVTLPKGGYTLHFQPRTLDQAAPQEPTQIAAARTPESNASRPKRSPHLVYLVLLAVTVAAGAVGWFRALTVSRPSLPWPLSSVVHPDSPTLMVLADAGFVLRMLGDNEVPLDQYISRSYLLPLLPKNMSPNEASVLQYITNSRLTSIADAHAVAAVTSLAGRSAQNLVVRSARDLNANDLSHGDLIFVGSHTSNPWVSVYEEDMNFQIREDSPHGSRYVVNHKPLPGERPTYITNSMGTLTSGEDYAVIACLPARRGNDNVLVIEGVRMEGSEAAVSLLLNEEKRNALRDRLAAVNHGRPPVHFEALLHAQSVAGVNVAVDVIALRALP